MGIGKERANIIYSMFEDGLNQTLGVALPKNKKKAMMDGFVKFENAVRDRTGMNLDHDQVIDIFGDYVVWAMDSFGKWSEAGAHNWIGYVCSTNRIASFIHRYNIQKPQVAGKEDSDAWNF